MDRGHGRTQELDIEYLAGQDGQDKLNLEQAFLKQNQLLPKLLQESHQSVTEEVLKLQSQCQGFEYENCFP